MIDTPARWLRSAALITALVTLASCGGDKPTTPTPTGTSETTTATTTPPPSPEELAGEAAMTTLTELVRVEDMADQDPAGRDWEPDIRQYAGDPYAAVSVQSVREYATYGIHQIGDSTVEAEVTAVDLTAPGGPTVLLTACFDGSQSDVVRVDTGESILPPGEPTRFVWNVTVVQSELKPEAPWLVTVKETHPDQPC